LDRGISNFNRTNKVFKIRIIFFRIVNIKGFCEKVKTINTLSLRDFEAKNPVILMQKKTGRNYFPPAWY